MKIYFGLIDDLGYGFLNENDNLVERGKYLIEITEDEKQELINNQCQYNMDIVSYDNKVFNAPKGQYKLNENKIFIKIDEKEYKKEQAKIRQEEFYNTFLATSKGNYRLQPKGYANAQQSVDTINGMVNAVGGLTQQIAQMVIFYPTPDFTKEEECTEAWLVAHQYNAEPMTKEEWTEFYIEFSTLYAMNQYKKANENVN